MLAVWRVVLADLRGNLNDGDVGGRRVAVDVLDGAPDEQADDQIGKVEN